MKRVEDYRWEDSNDDNCKTKFIKTLLRYDYVHDDKDFKLNLSEKEICSFLKDCRVFLTGINENEAVMKIRHFRELYFKERTSLAENSRNVNESKSPWFVLADKLFRRDTQPATAKASTSMPPKVRIKSSSFSQSSADSGEMLPLLQKAAALQSSGMSVSRAAVLNISAGGGSMTQLTEAHPRRFLAIMGYRTSKAAVNMAMRVISLTIKDQGILVVSMCPGWVNTDMGANPDLLAGTEIESLLTVEKSISDMLETLPRLNDAHHGSFINRNGEIIPY